jgi:hypothetical protein
VHPEMIIHNSLNRWFKANERLSYVQPFCIFCRRRIFRCALLTKAILLVAEDKHFELR